MQHALYLEGLDDITDISAGYRIGSVGKTGSDKYFAHLHFEIIKPEAYTKFYKFNPEFYPTKSAGFLEKDIREMYYDPLAFIDNMDKYGSPYVGGTLTSEESEAWKTMVDKGIFTDFTKVGESVPTERLGVFLSRLLKANK
jgi:hypothetical protein